MDMEGVTGEGEGDEDRMHGFAGLLIAEEAPVAEAKVDVYHAMVALCWRAMGDLSG